MSFGNNPADAAAAKRRTDKFMARAEARRLKRSAGYKSVFRRLVERMLTRRGEPGGG